MGVYIKDMKMPTSCYDCPLAMHDYTTLFGKNFYRTRNSDACVLTHKTITSTKRNRFCPLVPVPKHGRLIDADVLMELYADADEMPLEKMKVPIAVIRRNIMDMPTVIPASEEGET